MNRYDVLYNPRLNVHTVFALDPNGGFWNTGHAYRDEANAWAKVIEFEAWERRNHR
jgi:hypothetical protein